MAQTTLQNGELFIKSSFHTLKMPTFLQLVSQVVHFNYPHKVDCDIDRDEYHSHKDVDNSPLSFNESKELLGFVKKTLEEFVRTELKFVEDKIKEHLPDLLEKAYQKFRYRNQRSQSIQSFDGGVVSQALSTERAELTT